LTDSKSKVSSRVEECESLVGHKKYEEFYRLTKEGKISVGKQKNKYSEDEKRVLFLIEEILFIEGK
jgi:hypothetical protein